MSDKLKIVCICGSSRFVEEAAVKAWEFEKQGVLALGMNLLPAWYSPTEHHLAEAEGVTAILDALHLRKIDMADFVYVMNVEGYIGERTRYEIEYARRMGKPVHYLTGGSFPVIPTGEKQKENKMKTLTIAKVRVNSVTPAPAPGGSETTYFGAVYSEDPNSENKKWSQATPCLNLTITIDNPGAQGLFKEGEEIFLEFKKPVPVETASEAAPASA